MTERAESAAVVVGIDHYPDPAMPRLHGPVNDARAMARLLVDRFGFPADRVVTLLDAHATAARIEAALDHLVERVGPRGAAVFFFAGHGSQRFDPDGDEADDYDETLVPHDSGREPRPDRDITDDRLRVWLEALCARAASVTAILDCCHSGTGGRPSPADGVRWAPPGDRRPATGPLRAAAGSPPYVLVAACAADEMARERRFTADGPTLGLLSGALVEALEACADTDTWPTIMARVATRMRSLQPAQTPQLEGAGRDRRPFSDAGPARRWALARPDADGVRVALGRLHGLRAGDVLDLRPIDGEGSPRKARAVDVGPLASRCVPLPGHRLDGPQRAALPPGRPSLWALADDPAFADAFDLRLDCDALLEDDGAYHVLDGQTVTLRITHHGNMRVHLGLVALDPEDRVTVVLPEPGQAFEIKAFSAHHEVLDAALDGGVATELRLVLVACPAPFDLRPLEGDARSLTIPPVKNLPLSLYKTTVRISPHR